MTSLLGTIVFQSPNIYTGKKSNPFVSAANPNTLLKKKKKSCFASYFQESYRNIMTSRTLFFLPFSVKLTMLSKQRARKECGGMYKASIF